MRFIEHLEGLIEDYLWYRELGGPSPTARLDNASPSGCTPPMWLIRMIDVGVALDALTAMELNAVCGRFNALRAREAALRDATISHLRQLAGHRRRERDDARHWKIEEKSAWIEYARQDRRRQLFERTRDYRRGMDKLARMLGGEK